jgi:hypothetical protein
LSVLYENFLMLENNQNAARLLWSAERSALLADALRHSHGFCQSLRLRVYGESMLPTLWPGDVVEIAGCSLEEVRPGEIVLALHDGRLFLHRLLASEPNGFVLRGDSMPGPDPLFPIEALLGRLVGRAGEGLVSRSVSVHRFSDSADSSKSDAPSRAGHRSSSATHSAVRFDLGGKWSRAVGMLFCHWGAARRLALKLHQRRKSSAREIQDRECGIEMGSV